MSLLPGLPSLVTLFISCVLDLPRNARSIYLHLFCLIFLAGTDGPLMLSSSMSSWSSISFITPWRGLCPTRRSTVSYHLFRKKPPPSLVKGLPLLGARTLPRGRLRGVRYTRQHPSTILGLTTVPPEQEAPGGSSCYQLRPKA